MLSLNPTSTSVIASPGQSVYGNPVAFEATVSEDPYAGGTPTGGSVTFYDGSTSLGTVPLTDGTTAWLATSALPLGLQTISAVYSGDGQDFAGSTGTLSGGETIYSTTTTSVIASSTTIVSGQLVMLTATVSPGTVDGVSPTGTVQFMIDGSDYGAPMPISGGKAFITLNSLAPGHHPFSAIYNSDSLDFTGSRSPLQGGSVGGIGEGPYQLASVPATEASLNNPCDLAVDGAGDVFIADTGNNVVRERTPDGTIVIVAGDGSAGYSGDGGTATAAELNGPTAIALDGSGDLFIADTGNNVIREVRLGPDGTISTIAGGGSNGAPHFNGAATEAQLNGPCGLALDTSGNLFIADQNDFVIRELTPSGFIRTVAGDGSQGYSGDNGSATDAQLSFPVSVAVVGQDDLFIADSGNNVIREVKQGTITTVVGDGTPGFSGDGGPAITAELNNPIWVAADSSGDLFIADSYNYRIREVDTAGRIATVAGNGTFGSSGDGGPAKSAQFSWAAGSLAVDGSGDLFIADQIFNDVREVVDGTIETIAGGSEPQLTNSTGVAVDPQGNLFVADDGGVVYKVTPGGIITTVIAGLNQPGVGGDPTYTSGLAFNTNGDLLIADPGHNRILEDTPDGIVTVAGNGSSGYSGDGGLATAASLNYPIGLVVDAQGHLFIADEGNDVVREVTPGPDGLLSDGIITTVVSGISSGLGGQDGPGGLALDSSGDLFIADTGSPVVLKKTPGPDGHLADGTLTTLVAPQVFAGFGPGDLLNGGPSGLAVDAHGDLFIEVVSNLGGGLLEVFPNGIVTAISSFRSSVTWNSGDEPPYFYSSENTRVSFQGLAIDPQGDIFSAEYPGLASSSRRV